MKSSRSTDDVPDETTSDQANGQDATEMIRSIAEQAAARIRDTPTDLVWIARNLRAVEQYTTEAYLAAVHLAREDGQSWAEIGAALELSPEAAKERYTR